MCDERHCETDLLWLCAGDAYGAANPLSHRELFYGLTPQDAVNV